MHQTNMSAPLVVQWYNMSWLHGIVSLDIFAALLEADQGSDPELTMLQP